MKKPKLRANGQDAFASLPRAPRAWADRLPDGCSHRQAAQEQTESEYIRPCTVSSKLAVTPVASKSTYDDRWGKPDMGIEIQFARVTEAGQPE
jgi:hypothetical protein